MLEVYRDKPADKLIGKRKGVPALQIMGTGKVKNLIKEVVQSPEEMLVRNVAGFHVGVCAVGVVVAVVPKHGNFQFLFPFTR